MTPTEPTIDVCTVGYRDWTQREHCGQPAACEVRITSASQESVWTPACAGHADALQRDIAQRGGWRFEQRDPGWVRSIFNPPTADLIPLDTRRSA